MCTVLPEIEEQVSQRRSRLGPRRAHFPHGDLRPRFLAVHVTCYNRAAPPVGGGRRREIKDMHPRAIAAGGGVGSVALTYLDLHLALIAWASSLCRHEAVSLPMITCAPASHDCGMSSSGYMCFMSVPRLTEVGLAAVAVTHMTRDE